MRESLRKPLLFLVIVVAGSLLVLFDIPLILLLPLILLVGFVTLLALGSITIAEIRGGFGRIRNIGIIKRLDQMKFFEKNPAAGAPATPVPVKAVPRKEAGREVKRDTGEKPGMRGHVFAFFSSVRSLGSVLRLRGKQGKKVEDIDRLLDRAVSEKVSAPPPAATASPSPSPAMPSAGGGGGSAKPQASDDPFFSLSGDEFDEELLKGLGEDGDLAMPAAPEPAAPGAGLSIPDLPADESPPGEDISSAAGDILREAGGSGGDSLDEFKGLDGDAGLSDAEFGDLENLSLDDIGPDADPGDAAPEPEAPAAPAPAAVPAAGGAGVKTAWIPSDAPKNAGEAEDEISTQADMAAFAGGAGADEDLLSSIASDVKHTKKEQDLSLLRELKDFRAPASELEEELGGMYERMNLTQQAQKKKTPSPKGTK